MVATVWWSSSHLVLPMKMGTLSSLGSVSKLKAASDTYTPRTSLHDTPTHRHRPVSVQVPIISTSFVVRVCVHLHVGAESEAAEGGGGLAAPGMLGQQGRHAHTQEGPLALALVHDVAEGHLDGPARNP